MKALRAFSLVELLVVLAVLGVLVAVLLPGLSGAAERARSTGCLSNLKQVGIALRLYLDENSDHLPVMQNRPRNALGPVGQSIYDILGGKLGNPRALKCPSDRQRWFEETGSSYFWNFLLNGQFAGSLQVMGLPVRENGIPLFSDQAEFHVARGAGRGKNHLYADGAVKTFFTMEIEPVSP